MTFDEVRRSGKRITCKHPKLKLYKRYDFSVYRYVNDYLLHLCKSCGSDNLNDFLDCTLWEVEPIK